MKAPPPFTPVCIDLLRAGQSVRFTATGASMAPAIRDGDVLTVAPVPASELRQDDVVLYLTPRGLTAHRVVRRLAGTAMAFETCGDAPGSRLEQVADAAILGRVTRVEPTPRTFVVRLAAACERARVRLVSGLLRLRRKQGGGHVVLRQQVPEGRPRTGREARRDG